MSQPRRGNARHGYPVRIHPRAIWTLVLGCGLLCAGSLLASPAANEPDARGRIEGRVRAAGTQEPLAPANVLVLGTGRGVISDSDGTFAIEGVPVGQHVVLVSFLGYADQRDTVQVRSDRPATAFFELEPTIVGSVDAIEIRADRPLIDVRKTSTAHDLSAHDLESMIIQAPTLDNVVEQQPGVVRDRGKLHFRGGRADESLFVVDGIKVRDLLSGESLGDEVGARSAQEVRVMTGGFGAQYSQAMSGVVETRIKEGSRSWHGALNYDTDVLLGTRDTHYFHGELSGPNVFLAPLARLLGDDNPDLTFYGSFSGDLSNGYLPSVADLPGDAHLATSVSDQVLGVGLDYGDFFTPLAENRWRALAKTAWRIDADNKLSLSLTKTLTFTQDWGEADIGEVDRNVTDFPWAWAKHLDHHYTIARDVNIVSLNWNRTLGLDTRTNLRLWRHYSGQRKEVAGQRWDEYDTTRDSERADDSTFVNTPYFIDTGDATDWRDRFVVVWGLANDWSRRLGVHDLEWGFTTEYHEVQYMSLNARTVDLENELPLGDEYDLFRVTPNAGNLYLQDRFEYEGMNVNLGLAYDYWFPGPQVERALEQQELSHFTPALHQKFLDETNELFGHRYKGHMSPRIGVSFPVSERAHLFFNYGHYSQRPPYYYVYAKSSSQSGEEYPRIGNPTLNPKISVSYEIGSEYQFREKSAFRASLFWKDMYDYPTSIRLVMQDRTTSRSNFFMYWNMDYARSRGIELTLVQNRVNYLAGSLSYTYSVGKGKSSDPNKTKLIQETGGDSREPRLEEEFLWWNRPHKLTAQVNLRVGEREEPPRWLGFRWPNDFQARFYFMYRSGRAYTPLNDLGLEVGDPYSRNGPADMTCDFSLSKGFRFGGNRLTLSFNIYNLFDWRTPLSFDWVTGEAYEPGRGSLLEPTEIPSEYSAYLENRVRERVTDYIADYNRQFGKDPDATLVDSYAATVAEGITNEFRSTYYSYQNPSYYSQPRSFRMGISYAW